MLIVVRRFRFSTGTAFPCQQCQHQATGAIIIMCIIWDGFIFHIIQLPSVEMFHVPPKLYHEALIVACF